MLAMFAVVLLRLVAPLNRLLADDSASCAVVSEKTIARHSSRAGLRPSTLPETPDRKSQPLRIAVISDLNSSYGSTRYMPSVHRATLELVRTIRPNVVLITGDMVAGQKHGLDYPAMWEAFHRVVTDPLHRSGIAVAPTPGNHDAAPAFLKERAEYVSQWTSAGHVPAVEFVDRSGYPLYYSFRVGNVFFASIDAARVGPLSRTQIDWLDAQLSNTHASVKIVFGHLPIHPVAIQREREVLNDKALSELMSRHGVSAYVSGHHHAYYPGVVDGVRHIAMPCLGSGTRRLIGTTRASPTALVVLDVEDDVLQAPVALQAPDFSHPIARTSLPAEIRLGRHRVVRDDLAGLAPLRSVGDTQSGPLNL